MTNPSDALRVVVGLAEKATPGVWAQAHRKTYKGYSTEVFDEAGEAIATLAWHAKPPRLEGSQKVISTDRPENAEAIAAAVNFIREHGAALAQALENDARYRFLRKNHLREWESDMPHNKGAPSLDIDFSADGHDLDAAIDSAIAAQQKEAANGD